MMRRADRNGVHRGASGPNSGGASARVRGTHPAGRTVKEGKLYQYQLVDVE